SGKSRSDRLLFSRSPQLLQPSRSARHLSKAAPPTVVPTRAVTIATAAAAAHVAGAAEGVDSLTPSTPATAPQCEPRAVLRKQRPKRRSNRNWRRRSSSCPASLWRSTVVLPHPLP